MSCSQIHCVLLYAFVNILFEHCKSSVNFLNGFFFCKFANKGNNNIMETIGGESFTRWLVQMGYLIAFLQFSEL